MGEESREELLACLRPDETVASLLKRGYVERRRTNIPFIDNHLGSLKPGRVLEVAGASGSGKTELLLQLCVNCILPKSYMDVLYGGSEGVAIFIDLDGRFPAGRLKRVLAAHLIDAAEIRTGRRWIPPGLAQACLQRFHLIQCSSSFEFLAVLRLLDRILEPLHAFGTPKLLAIDNISAFYWMDRANHTVSRTPSASGAVIPLSIHRVQKAVGQQLAAAGQNFHLAVVVSCTSSVVIKKRQSANPEEEATVIWDKNVAFTEPLNKIFSERLLLVPMTKLPDFVRGVRQPGGIVAYWKIPIAPRIHTFQITDGVPRYGVLE
ncbi:hypothetical protein BSKO_10780 [Bryopsis sp. KO-2023]|nr:hypothetical protein BSKO_10780 [Bryopsis sp. KO-2023]